MRFTKEQCLERIKSPLQRDLIRRAADQELRLELHCQPDLQRDIRMPSDRALWGFLNWVKGLLPNDKYERFKQLLFAPLDTVDFTETIFDELSKFLDAPDENTKVEFRVPDYEDDFTWFLDEVIKDGQFWRDTVLHCLRVGINSFVVADLPREQTTTWPEPYIFTLPCSSIYDGLLKERDGEPEYLVYWETDRSLIFLDDGYFRRFVLPENESEWVFDFEKPHNLNRVPATPFYRNSISKKNPWNKKGPITGALGKLDWLLFWRVSQRYLQLYGSYPIIVNYETRCEYKDNEGNECNEGVINYFDGELPRCKPCPACIERKASGLIGPGSQFKVPAPRDGQDSDLMQNPVKFIEPSNDKLTYGDDKTKLLEDEIFLYSVGYLNTNPTKEAINEKQVASTFESRETILDRIREQVDQTRKFALDALATLRYGDLYVRCEVFGGREYFLHNADDIIRRYKFAKSAGLPQYEVARLRQSYSRTLFKNNNVQYLKSMILEQLEPYPDLSPSEMKEVGLDLLDPESFLLKLNFSSYISRFEREEMSIIEFGELIPFSTKISIINSKLLTYVRESIKSTSPDTIARLVSGRNAQASSGAAARE